MDLIKIQNFNFTYANSEERALKDINLRIKKGEFIVICGASGCGKTTLMSQLKREIRPTGYVSGDIFYKGAPIDSMSKACSVKEIAMVFQNPENQIVLNTVLHELTFPLENMGYDIRIMERRIGEISSFFGLGKMLKKPVEDLSGGEKQILNLASVLLLRPRVLLLDEPTSQLDPIAAKGFLQMVYRLNRELSMTVLISEHRLEDVFPLADRVILMEKGRVKDVASPKTLSYNILSSDDKKAGKYLPSIVRLYSYLEGDIREENIPLDVREAKGIALDLIKERKEDIPEGENPSLKNPGKPIMSLRNINFAYSKGTPNIIDALNLNIFPGEFITILGENGAGKSTLLQIMAGLKRPQKGKIYFQGKDIWGTKNKGIQGKIGYLAQNPMLYFAYDTVKDELYKRRDALGTDDIDIEIYAKFFDLKPLFSRHPYDLSGGEKQKLALAIVLLSNPGVLLLDEPTKGLDPLFKSSFKLLLEDITKRGVTIIMVSHDIEFVAGCSKTCGLLFNGRIVGKDSVRNFFSDNYFYTTAVNRAVREWLPRAITLEDVKNLCAL